MKHVTASTFHGSNVEGVWCSTGAGSHLGHCPTGQSTEHAYDGSNTCFAQRFRQVTVRAVEDIPFERVRLQKSTQEEKKNQVGAVHITHGVRLSHAGHSGFHRVLWL